MESSKDSAVDYHRCDHCGHVWSVDKKNPKATPRDVTLQPPKKD